MAVQSIPPYQTRPGRHQLVREENLELFEILEVSWNVGWAVDVFGHGEGETEPFLADLEWCWVHFWALVYGLWLLFSKCGWIDGMRMV